MYPCRLRVAAAVATLGACTAIALAVECGRPPERSLDALFRQFARVAPRPFRARLPVDLPYRPAEPRQRSGALGTPVEPSAELRLVAAQIGLAADADPESVVKGATVRLLLGDIAGALAKAEEADPAALRADVSILRAAAHLARYEESGDTIDAAGGLEWALRALERGGHVDEARHNMGLALNYLGARTLAGRTWSMAANTGRTLEWRREAATAAAEALGEADRPTQTRLIADAWTRTHIIAALDYRASPDLVREVFERTIVPTWIRLVADGRTQQAGTDAVRVVAQTLTERTGDRQPLETVEALVRACSVGPRPCRQAARVYQSYVDGRAAWDAYRPQAAYGHFEAVSSSTQPHLPESGWARIHLALRDYYAGRLAAARRRVEATLERARKDRHLATAGRSAWMLGLIAHEEGDLGRAVAMYEEALGDLTRCGEREHRGAVRNLIGNYYRLLGDLPQGWTHTADSLSTLSVAGPLRRSLAYYNASALAAEGGLTSAATFFLREATLEAERTASPVLVAQALTDEARNLVATGRQREARAALERAREVLSRAMAPDEAAIVLAAIDVEEASLTAEVDPGDAARHLTDALRFWEHHGTGLNIPALLLNRGRALARQGLVSAAVADWNRGAALAARQLHGIASREERLALRASQWDLHAELADTEARRAGNRVRALEVLDAGRALDVRTRLGGAADLVVARDQRVVPADTAILVYETYPDHTLAWVWTQNSLVSFEIPLSEQDLDSAVERHTQAIVADDRTEVRRSGGALFAALTGPAVDMVRRARRVVVVAGRGLTALPFATLFDERQGRYLVEWASSQITPSLGYWLTGVRGAGHTVGHFDRATVVGAPVTAPSARLVTLPSARQEAEVTAGLYRNATLLLGRDATRGRFLSALRTANVVHFAGHAIQNSARPYLSWLALTPDGSSPDGAVFASDVDQLNLESCRLVVLAACSTARGARRGGEGVVGLVSAFLGAGADAVVATLWPIDDAASRPLFENLHVSWQRSQDTAEAVRTAQLAMMERDAGRVAISAWAAPVAVGRGPSVTVRRGGQ